MVTTSLRAAESTDDSVAVGIQPYWIQERPSSMSNFVDLLKKRDMGASDDRWCHKRQRSYPTLGSIQRIEPQQQADHDGKKKILSNLLDHPSQHDNMSRTSIQICKCTHLEFPGILSSTCGAVDLSTIDEIRFQHIRRTNEPSEEQVTEVLQSSPSNKDNSFVGSIIILLKRTKPKRLIVRDCNLQVSDLFRIMEGNVFSCHSLKCFTVSLYCMC